MNNVNNKENQIKPSGIVLYIIIFVLSTFVVIAAGIFITMFLFLKGPSINARNSMVIKMHEQGNDAIIKAFLSEEEINGIVNYEEN